MKNVKIGLNDYRNEAFESLRWLEMYHKTVVGLAALAEQHSAGCDAGWLAMTYGLEDLADSMSQDIEGCKKFLGDR